MIRISLNGCFLENPLTIETPLGKIGIFANHSTILAPPPSILEKSMVPYVKRDFSTCLNSISEPLGISFSLTASTLEIIFATDEVDTVIGGIKNVDASTQEIKQVSAIADIRYVQLYHNALEIIQSISSTHSVDLGLLNSFDAEIEIVPISADTKLIFLTDPSSRINSRPYVFTAAFIDAPIAPIWKISSVVTSGHNYSVLEDPSLWDIVTITGDGIQYGNTLNVPKNSASIKITVRNPNLGTYEREIKVEP